MTTHLVVLRFPFLIPFFFFAKFPAKFFLGDKRPLLPPAAACLITALFGNKQNTPPKKPATCLPPCDLLVLAVHVCGSWING